MKYLYFLSLLFIFLNASHAQDANESSPAQPDSPFLSSDFFSGALADAQEADAEDAMGTQRLVQVKSSDLTPAVALSSSFKYTSNPEKAADPTKKDGTAPTVECRLRHRPDPSPTWRGGTSASCSPTR